MADVRLAQRHRAQRAPRHVKVLERRADQRDGGDDGVVAEEAVELLLALQVRISEEHGGNWRAVDEKAERGGFPSRHAVGEQPAQRAEDDEEEDEQRAGVDVREAPAELAPVPLQRRQRGDEDHRIDQHDAQGDGHRRAGRHLAHRVLQHAADDGHEPSAPPVDERDGHRQQHEAGVNDEDHGDSWPLAVGRWPLAVGRWPLAVEHGAFAAYSAPPLPTVNRQLSTANCQPPTVNRELPTNFGPARHSRRASSMPRTSPASFDGMNHGCASR